MTSELRRKWRKVKPSFVDTALRRAYPLWRELKTLSMAWPTLWRYAIASQREWKKSLPVQAHSSVQISGLQNLDDMDAFSRWLGIMGAPEGHDSYYLSPSNWRKSSLAFLLDRYPSNVGLKVSKSAGGVDAFYSRLFAGRKAQQLLSGSHKSQTLLYNFLCLKGISPRLYDLVEMVDEAGNKRTAYVVEHVEGSAPSADELDSVVSRLKSLEREGMIRLVSGDGWESRDFQRPDGNGNVVVVSGQQPLYVDVHNFILGRYDRHLKETARAVSGASHFGNKSILLGGSYLYQEIPGIPLPAKRSPAQRMKIYDSLLASAGVDLSGKVVMDVGCNLGLMGAEYLRRGAAWVHGWDMPHVVDASHQTLLSIGCTRFSHTPAHLSDDLNLFESLPDHIKTIDRDDGVLNYLAIRGHVGWLRDIKNLPWRFMIYEGHQDDAPLEQYVAELNEWLPVRVVAHSSVFDANSTSRDSAIIQRI
ncbi:hypothetical protein Plav_1911 [Parvibaculum lavamentivorans DS-1]|uniref:Uncharacterized protein n=1 Tax=Parvibaculum lavamentivorans (strain DS-1 / DSM 13023 / NCIMB 13966) TaxID=402881 RepID=A7HUE3_PARL1|nr:hypothetical protein [Parvibaculum lavamentivorans]ABS63526.1 hypothetical protein Plav_1911 [Parvibaculum lavamentivorans DS-1]